MRYQSSVGTLTLVGALGASTLAQGTPFEIVMIPDTQSYTVDECWEGPLGSNPNPNTECMRHFRDQIEWVNANASSVAFLTHVGDVVENGIGQVPCATFPGPDWVEWQKMPDPNCPNFGLSPSGLSLGGATDLVQFMRADSAMRLLNVPGLPYSISLGNHDFDSGRAAWSSLPVYDIDQGFQKFFGPLHRSLTSAVRYEDEPWVVDYDPAPDGTSCAQVFQGGGESYLHLNLELSARDSVIDWARGVMDRYPNLPTIVTTHRYLTPTNGRTDQGESRYQRFSYLDPTSCMWKPFDQNGDIQEMSTNSGEGIFQKLVLPNPQVFMVLCGHNVGSAHQLEVSLLGRNIHEIMANYQNGCEGGSGWFQVLRVEPANGSISVRAESGNAATPPVGYVCPSSGCVPKDFSNEPSYNYNLNMDLSGLRRDLTSHKVDRFQRGASFSTGGDVLDTYVDQAHPGVKYGEEDVAYAENPAMPMGDVRESLLYFDVSALPTTANVVRAVVTLTFEDTDGWMWFLPTPGPAASSTAGAIHALQAPFTESSTWNSLGGGAPLGAQVGTTTQPVGGPISLVDGTRSYDITSLVQSWVNNPTTNFGIAILSGDDDLRWRTSDWHYVAERPLLTVITGP